MIRCACKLISVFLILVLLVGSALSASTVRLIGTRVEPQPDGSNLIIITFDKPVGAVLLNKEGREFGIMIKGLLSSSSGLSLDGAVVGYRLRDETLTVETGRFMRASLLSGGTGILVLSLSPSSGSVKTGSGEVAENGDGKAVAPLVKRASAAPEGKSAVEPVPTQRNADKSVLYGKALKNIKEGKTEQAIQLLEQIKPGDSLYGKSRLELGDLLVSLNRPVSAIAAYDEAAKQPGTREAATVKLAVAYQRIGAPEKAEQYWANALAMVEKKPGATAGKAGDGDSQSSKRARNNDGRKRFSFQMGDLREITPYLIVILFLLVGGGMIGLRVSQNIRMKKVMGRLEQSNADEEEVDIREEIPKPALTLKEETESEQRDLAKELAAWQTGQEEPEVEPQSGNGTGDADTSNDSEEGEEPQRGKPAKWERIEEMHRLGADVRKIAESLGLGQDEVKTAISLMEEQKTA